MNIENISNEFILGIATCITTVICAIIPCLYSALSNKNRQIYYEQYTKVFFPVMCLLEKTHFSFSSLNEATKIISDINNLLKDNRILAGEKFQQYIYDFEKSKTLKEQRKEFSYLCEYTIKQFNKMAKKLGLPIISFNIRVKRYWYNRYSVKFLVKYFLLILFEFAIAFCIFITLTAVLYYILQYILLPQLQQWKLHH